MLHQAAWLVFKRQPNNIQPEGTGAMLAYGWNNTDPENLKTLSAHMMLDAMTALLSFPRVISHRFSRSLITETRKRFSCSSCMLPLMLPMAQHSVFSACQVHFCPACCCASKRANTVEVKRNRHHRATILPWLVASWPRKTNATPALHAQQIRLGLGGVGGCPRQSAISTARVLVDASIRSM